MQLKKLVQICQLLNEAGHGDSFIAAEHDQIFLLPPDTVEPESELGQQLTKLGARYNDSDGWTASA